jgi:hypothetical protein
MPPESTVRKWVLLDNPPGFSAQYARARELQIEAWADELVDIAADGTNDWMKRRTATGGGRSNIDGEVQQELVPNVENINRSRLHADTKKWLMSKIAPKRYGEKLAVHGDAEEAPIQHKHVVAWKSGPPKFVAGISPALSSSHSTTEASDGLVSSPTDEPGKP